MTTALTLDAARRVAANMRCAACGGRLIIDHDDDPFGHGRLHCLACGHEIAAVKLVENRLVGSWRR